MLRWLVLDLNSFFASCEQQENPELRGKPVIVVPTMAETTCAIAASYPAKAFGIKTGTLVHEARRLCPDVQLVQAHHKLYVEYHHRILAAIDKHIPVEEVMSIDEVACRLDKVQQDPAVAQTAGAEHQARNPKPGRRVPDELDRHFSEQAVGQAGFQHAEARWAGHPADRERCPAPSFT